MRKPLVPGSLESGPPRYVLGLDPGRTGGMAMLSQQHDLILALPLPCRRTDLTDADPSASMLRDLILINGQSQGPELVVCEKVTPFAKGSRQSAFTFGRFFQVLIDLCELQDWPMRLEVPYTWKKQVLNNTSSDKSIALKWVNRKFKTLNTDHDGVADAVCMAEFAWLLTFGGLN